MVRLAALVVVAIVAFAANSVLARLAIGAAAVGAGGYTGVRLLAGAITLALLVAMRRRPLRLRDALQNRTRWITATALFVYAIAFSFAYLLLGAGTGALILFATVQFSILGWALFKGDRPGAIAFIGLAIALGAFAYLVSPGLKAPDPVGAFLMVTAGIAWAVYTLLGRGSSDPLTDTAQNFVLTVPAALLCLVSLAFDPVSLTGVGWAVASGALASGIGYAVWYAVLPRLTRSQAGILQLSVPAIAAMGGIAFIGEAPTFRLGIASALILGGVAIAILSPARRR